MGLYDTVLVPCPACELDYDAQSKGGHCTLTTYTMKDAPDDVYSDVNRHAPFICECGNMFDAPPRESEVFRLRAENVALRTLLADVWDRATDCDDRPEMDDLRERYASLFPPAPALERAPDTEASLLAALIAEMKADK